jgi:hypothetical protein
MAVEEIIPKIRSFAFYVIKSFIVETDNMFKNASKSVCT